MLLMAVVNRRSGMTHGNAKILQSMVLFPWKGIQVAKSFSGWIGQTASDARNSNSIAKAVEFAARFRGLSKELRNIWELYASSFGSAVDREKSDNVATARNVIPNRKKLMSGINAYVAENIKAVHAGMAAPFDNPPYGESVPPPPTHLKITSYDSAMGIATVTWTDPVLADTPVAAFVRLWATVQAKKKIYPQIVKHLTVPTGGTTTFDKLRVGRVYGNNTIELKGIGKGLLRIQCDSLVQRKAGQAPLSGPRSNVDEFSIN